MDKTNILNFKEVDRKIVVIRDQRVILDSDVAALYGVETKRINEAVKNNPDKFPRGYIFELSLKEKAEVVENFDYPFPVKFSPTLPKAFTEKGLYMLGDDLHTTDTETTIEMNFALLKVKHTIKRKPSTT